VTTRDFPFPLPTTRLAWLVAAAAAPVAAGALLPVAAWIGLVAMAALLVAAIVDWAALPRARDLRVARVEREALSHGDEEALAVEVELLRGRSVSLRVVDDLADGLRRVCDPAPTSVAVGEPVRLATRAMPTSRGRLRLGAVHLRVASAWGWAERQIEFDLPAEVRVHPGLRAVRLAARRLRPGRREEAGRRRSRRRGEGTSFESLREYKPGDDPRAIDWKASAKHAKLIARHYEVERDQSVLLVVDCGRWMTGEVAGRTRLDHVLEACVVLAHVAAARDDRVGLLAFADEVLAYVPPTKGAAAVEAILDATLGVAPRLVESDYAGAFAFLASRRRKRSLLVLFTDVLSADASRAVLAECIRAVRRHLPLAVTLRDSGLDAVAAGEPRDAGGAYRQAAAEEVLLEREQALALLRRAGVQLLDVAPSSLGPDLVEKYLDVKSRLLV
jgi:uncharacterized protein (DUF58 family)